MITHQFSPNYYLYSISRSIPSKSVLHPRDLIPEGVPPIVSPNLYHTTNVQPIPPIRLKPPHCHTIETITHESAPITVIIKTHQLQPQNPPRRSQFRTAVSEENSPSTPSEESIISPPAPIKIGTPKQCSRKILPAVDRPSSPFPIPYSQDPGETQDPTARQTKNQ